MCDVGFLSSHLITSYLIFFYSRKGTPATLEIVNVVDVANVES